MTFASFAAVCALAAVAAKVLPLLSAPTATPFGPPITTARYGLSETTKTGRKRYVPISPIVKEVLQKLMREQRGDFVFCDKDGVQLDAHHLYRDFHNSQKRAGFQRLIRFHDLRHTFASHFMMNGGNIYDLQKILGHTSLEMTQRYAHMSPDHLAEAIQIVAFKAEGENVASIEEARAAKTSGNR